MAFTQTQLDAIESAIASGELRVMFNGREIIYRSIDDLMKARNVVKAALEAAGAAVAVVRTSYASYGRD